MGIDAKVSRDGTVTVDGTAVGRVERVIRQGIFATVIGASVSGSGTPYWIPYATDGTQLHEYGYDTRKRAAKRVADHAQPLAVSDLALKSAYPMFGGDKPRQYVSATVTTQGHYFGVTRYASESHWIIDFYCAPDSICPVWSNGEGTRVTAGRGLADGVASVVTDAAIAAGVWPIPGDRTD